MPFLSVCRFSLGNCVACGDSVLPDAATPFVQRKDKLWHAECCEMVFLLETTSSRLTDEVLSKMRACIAQLIFRRILK